MNTLLLKETGAEFYQKWFSQKKSKQFVTHVDTLYFMVKPEIENFKESKEWETFTAHLLEKKEKAERIRENIPVFEKICNGGLEVAP
ncbi:MAG: hypothetical protein LBD23_01485 [Oscillospiraceae bacterium]|nr:hypothetical protein [Oscillospiraceae bacterium]